MGRAILMLVEEIDRLNIDLWHARMAQGGEGVVSPDEKTEDEEQSVTSSLHGRLSRVLRREARSAAEPVEQSGSDTDTGTSGSPQAWIAELRRQK